MSPGQLLDFSCTVLSNFCWNCVEFIDQIGENWYGIHIYGGLLWFCSLGFVTFSINIMHIFCLGLYLNAPFWEEGVISSICVWFQISVCAFLIYRNIIDFLCIGLEYSDLSKLFITFILFGVLWYYWIWGLVSVNNFEKNNVCFGDHLFKYFFFHFSLYFPAGLQFWLCYVIPYRLQAILGSVIIMFVLLFLFTTTFLSILHFCYNILTASIFINSFL